MAVTKVNNLDEKNYDQSLNLLLLSQFGSFSPSTQISMDLVPAILLKVDLRTIDNGIKILNFNLEGVAFYDDLPF